MRKGLLVNLEIPVAYQPQHGSSAGSQVGPAGFGTRKGLGCGSAPLSPISWDPHLPGTHHPLELISTSHGLVQMSSYLGPKQVPRPSQCQQGGKRTPDAAEPDSHFQSGREEWWTVTTLPWELHRPEGLCPHCLVSTHGPWATAWRSWAELLVRWHKAIRSAGYENLRKMTSTIG